MKFLIYFFTCLLGFYTGHCQHTTDSANKITAIKVQAEAMGQTYLNSDFASFTNYTHPKIIEMIGGKKKMQEVLEKGMQGMKADSISISNITFGEPSTIINLSTELQTTIPQILEMKVPGGKLKTSSTLIAISLDNGRKWYFIDTSGKDLQALRKIFPDLSADLHLPVKQKPVFTKD